MEEVLKNFIDGMELNGLRVYEVMVNDLRQKVENGIVLSVRNVKEVISLLCAVNIE